MNCCNSYIRVNKKHIKYFDQKIRFTTQDTMNEQSVLNGWHPQDSLVFVVRPTDRTIWAEGCFKSGFWHMAVARLAWNFHKYLWLLRHFPIKVHLGHQAIHLAIPERVRALETHLSRGLDAGFPLPMSSGLDWCDEAVPRETLPACESIQKSCSLLSSEGCQCLRNRRFHYLACRYWPVSVWSLLEWSIWRTVNK